MRDRGWIGVPAHQTLLEITLQYCSPIPTLSASSASAGNLSDALRRPDTLALTAASARMLLLLGSLNAYFCANMPTGWLPRRGDVLAATKRRAGD